MSLARAADWLLTKEVRRKGDWSVKRPGRRALRLGTSNSPTSFIPISTTPRRCCWRLHHARGTDAASRTPACGARVDWLLAMQSKDGGWAAFDVDNNWEFLSAVPFADHNAMLDPTCPDITGRVLEALAACGLERDHPAVRRGVEFLKRTPGARRKLVRPLGRGLHLRHVLGAARAWRAGRKRPRSATSCAPANGCAPSRTPTAAGARAAPVTTTNTFMPRPSTPSQTAWAILGLLAGGDTHSRSVAARASNIWWRRSAPMAAGMRSSPPAPDFPRVFYLQYHYVPAFVSRPGSCELSGRRGPTRELTAHESSTFPSSRYGHLYRQEQAAPEPEWQKNRAAEEDA